MTVAIGRTFRLPDGIDAPPEYPYQIALPDLWTDEDLHEAAETVEAWQTLAGRFLCRSQSASIAPARFRFRQQAEDVAAVACELTGALHEQMRTRMEGL